MLRVTQCAFCLTERLNDAFLFGDEIEYMLIKFDFDRKKAKILLQSEEYLQRLGEMCASQGDQVSTKC